MKIGILQCDDVRPELQKKHGNYPEMFMHLLRRVDSTLQFQVWRCHKGQIPDSDTDVDAWLITGSKYGVNDGLTWVEQLCDLIRQFYALKKPVVGVCFGHQLITHALSGTVQRSPKGWGIGLACNSVSTQQPWMRPWQPTLSLLVSHQDQVLRLPAHASTLASSPFCPHYLIQIGPTFLGLQGHPEFTDAYAADLMAYQRQYIPNAQIESALASLGAPQDDFLMAQWLLNFMATAQLHEFLHFWLEDIAPGQWRQFDPDFDALLKKRYLRLLQHAAAGELYAWRQTAKGRLAEIIVLDQLSRNIYRDTPTAFSQDAMALALAQEAVAAGCMSELNEEESAFLLMPYMHSESKIIHMQAETLFKQYAPSRYEAELKHKAIIDRFGRYPHRNQLLGRVSTTEEIEFLKLPGSSF